MMTKLLKVRTVPAILPMLVLLMLTSFICCPVLAQQRDQFVVLNTTKGRIIIRVYSSMVPYTAGRFLMLTQNGFYNGLTFHRVEDWVVQGGDPSGSGNGNYCDPNTGEPQFLKLECHPQLKHHPGAVAMARTSNPNSASCQFYICKRNTPFLNGQYAVFGQVVDGASVVMRLQRGDTILNASMYTGQNQDAEAGGGGGWQSAEDLPAVPGAITEEQQQRAAQQEYARAQAIERKRQAEQTTLLQKRFRKNTPQPVDTAPTQPPPPATPPKVEEPGF